jgi:segregation and condensation protein A
MAEKPKAEKIVPWWQRILRRAVDGLRSGFGLLRRSSAGRSGNGEDAASGNVDADRSGEPNLVSESQNLAQQVELQEEGAEIQIAGEQQEEIGLMETTPHSDSYSNGEEEQVIEASITENANPEQPKADAIAADESAANGGSEPAEDPVAEPIAAELQIEVKQEEGTELIESSPQSETTSEILTEQAVDFSTAEIVDLQQPEADAGEETDGDAERIEPKPAAPEEHEALEPIADPPYEEAIVAHSEAVAESEGLNLVASSAEESSEETAAGAVEMPFETKATEEHDAPEPAPPAMEFAQEEAQNSASSCEDAAPGQPMDEPEEVAVVQEAEPVLLPEREPAPEEASPEKPKAAQEEETPAEVNSAPELNVVLEDAPSGDVVAAEEFPNPEDTPCEARPAAEEANVGAEGAVEANAQAGQGETQAVAMEPQHAVMLPIDAEPAPAAEVPPVVLSSIGQPVAEEQPAAEPLSTSTAPVPAEPSAEERKKAERVAAAVKARSQSEEESPFSVIVGQVYEGPLDLLLDLIRKQDIDIYDIPIAKITAQFLAYVDHLRASDMDVAGDFIYTAALLIHIKSKMLLPREPAGPDDAAEDPRRELVERLLEHERFKNAAQMLQQKQLLEAATWTHAGLREFRDEADADSEIAADTVDLVRVFREVLERARNRPVMNLEEDSVTVGQMIRFLSRRLTMEDRPIALRRLLSQAQSERVVIAMFLALLELVRLQAILLRQDRQFSEIFIKRHIGFDALMNEGLEIAKDDWR